MSARSERVGVGDDGDEVTTVMQGGRVRQELRHSSRHPAELFPA
ncbi:hypothetical protein [Streptomyces sp. NPDC012510]